LDAPKKATNIQAFCRSATYLLLCHLPAASVNVVVCLSVAPPAAVPCANTNSKNTHTHTQIRNIMVRTSKRKNLINSLEESIQEDMMKLAVNLALDDGEYDLKSLDDENGENEMIMNDIEDKSRELKAILAKQYLNSLSKIEKFPQSVNFC
jgi:hypothetical protein